MGKIVVIGSSNTDMVVTSPKLPLPGETIMGNEFYMVAGGKGANQAVAASRAGGDVMFIAKVGDDDFGKNALYGYQKDNIDTSNISIDQDMPSGIAVILVDEVSGQNSIVVAPGSNSKLSIDDIKAVENEIKLAEVVLVQLEIPIETVKYALQIAKGAGVKTILNPAPAQALSDELLRLVDIITPNETETQLLIGINPVDEASIEFAAEKLLEKVNDTAMITLGSRGVYYCSKNGDKGYVPSIKVDAVDSTAAGDVFNGYFATYLAADINYDAAIRLANKAAAISVTRKGAQPSIPKIEEVEEFAKKVSI
ncbi:MAG: ribokinase [Salinivirgaceae bacterium]|jgi:ribokinase|nr:ribokinase [Salinivirgaceae bacterium]